MRVVNLTFAVFLQAAVSKFFWPKRYGSQTWTGRAPDVFRNNNKNDYDFHQEGIEWR